ncbi:hypothetical protein D8674_025010 [Pyrus ussuriensis x Pyrus communis]|uniref:Uncharacterized protein n=1 Tax=Pyrus ussuriensis x Pyrus communis TaxID=2448454 RepID=A0A5N5H5G9_9ROSA|nr:hypothetical protein D8674_025010 [Pyrus ussuriensis x Pyrus communis]
MQMQQEADFGLTVGFLVGMDIEEEVDSGLTVGFLGYMAVAAVIFAVTTDSVAAAGCMFVQA